MDIGSAVSFSAPICVGVAALGSGIGLGLAVAGAMEAIGRQPSAYNKILTAMIIGAALIEALTIYALIVFFILLGKMDAAPTSAEVKSATALLSDASIKETVLTASAVVKRNSESFLAVSDELHGAK